MKSLGYFLLGLYLLGITAYAAWSGEIPGRYGSGAVTVATSPLFFWFGIVGFTCIGLALIWKAIVRRLCNRIC